MKMFSFFILLLLSASGFSQQISGYWHWSSEDQTARFSLNLKETEGTVTGSHCAVFDNGKRIDCSETDEEPTIRLQLVSENVYEGSIESTYSNTLGKVRLEYNPQRKTLKFLLTEKPPEEFYLPTEAVFL